MEITFEELLAKTAEEIKTEIDADPEVSIITEEPAGPTTEPWDSTKQTTIKGWIESWNQKQEFLKGWRIALSELDLNTVYKLNRPLLRYSFKLRALRHILKLSYGAEVEDVAAFNDSLVADTVEEGGEE